MHIFCRQVQKANHDAASKVGIELGLIIDDVHKALGQVELHMKVREIGGNATPQALQQWKLFRDTGGNMITTNLCGN